MDNSNFNGAIPDDMELPPLPPDFKFKDYTSLMTAVSATLLALAGILVGLRFLAKTVLTRGLNWADWSVLAGLVFSGVLVAWTLIGTKYGASHPDFMKDPAIGQTHMFATYMTLIFYWPAATFVKISFVPVYLRLTSNRRVTILCHAVLAVTIAGGISFLLVAVFPCWPVSNFWKLPVFLLDTAESGYCGKAFKAGNVGAVFNAVVDIVLLLLPMGITRGVVRTRRLRAALYFVFLLGGLVCAASVVRVWVLFDGVDNMDDIDEGGIEDSPTLQHLLSIIEPLVGIICACLPYLRTLTSRFFPKFFGTISGTSPASDSSNPRSSQAAKPFGSASAPELPQVEKGFDPSESQQEIVPPGSSAGRLTFYRDSSESSRTAASKRSSGRRF